MSILKQFTSRIPLWAYLLMLTVIIVNSVYLHYKNKFPEDGLIAKFENGLCIAVNFKPGSAAFNAGLRTGDRIVSIDSIPVEEWFSRYFGQMAGDTITYNTFRDNKEIHIPVILGSYFSTSSRFFWSVYIIMLLFNIASLYILFKKPRDRAVRLFFVYLQLFSVTVNAMSLPFPDLTAIIACNVFLLGGCLLGPLLIHFHLLFPRPVQLFSRFKRFPLIFYVIAVIVFIPYSASQYYFATSDVLLGSLFGYMDRIGLGWMTLTFILALATAIYQFLTVKDTLSRNQLRMVIIGSFFGFITPMFYALFYNYVNQLGDYSNLILIPHGIGSLIMICCILIAIFRYRIWDVEVFMRKALLYLGATLVITLAYLLLIWVVDRSIILETNLTRFLILASSFIVFLVLRDRIQRMIDRFFHRESYDSATVVSDFEEKLAGIYRFDELKQKIAQSMDEIFHFKSFVFNLKKNDLIYEPAFVYGINDQKICSEYEITLEFEEKLRKSKVFSPGELNEKPSLLDISKGELIVPMVSDNRPNGFFVCGPKMSERIYSHQDIRVLSLLARRVVALFHTAELYQKDLDRELMLERERARISQDMHDDVGASLTRISILSELAKNNAEIGGETKQWLGQISDTSRGVMEEMSQIIWALNPRNDTLEGLVAYIRRFANEYLEPTSVNCSFDLPEALPTLALSVEVRRNIYLVVREALHNVVKHSGASEVRISLRMNGISQLHPPSPSSRGEGAKGERSPAPHQFIINIKDNGSGFDPDRIEFPGNGLINMKKRMSDIGGEFLVNSTSNDGTEISLVVKK